MSFYADGDTVRTAPMLYCDVRVRDCEKPAEPATLSARAGMPVQVSIPGDVADTPWSVTVQYRTNAGKVRYSHATFTSGQQHAYTADPPGSSNQILVVEIQQLGGALTKDANGNLQPLARGVWSLQVEPQH